MSSSNTNMLGMQNQESTEQPRELSVRDEEMQTYSEN